MEFLPVFLELKDKPCLVVGGGEVAARKAALLLRAGASLRVVSPILGTTLQRHLEADEIAHESRRFEEEDLRDIHLAVAATDDPEVNRRVAILSQRMRIPVNVVDRPELCSFVMPSVSKTSTVWSFEAAT